MVRENSKYEPPYEPPYEIELMQGRAAILATDPSIRVARSVSEGGKI
jgi:hypothetical protein